MAERETDKKVIQQIILKETEDAELEKKSRKKKATQLPHDIIFQILLTLPNKSLSNLFSVSGDFEAIISDPTFLHLRPATQPSLVLQPISGYTTDMVPYLGDTSRIELILVSTPHNHDQVVGKTVWIEKPATVRSHIFQMFDSCDGLLAFEECDQGQVVFHIYNSLTNKWIAAPPIINPKPLKHVFSFHRHPSTGTYRILVYDDETKCYMVHTLGTGSWRKLSHTPDHDQSRANCSIFTQRTPISVSGRLHWPRKRQTWRKKEFINEIVVFDMDTEAFSILPTPVDFLESYYSNCGVHCYNKKMRSFIETEAGLGFPVYITSTIDIWVLKDYTREGWVKEYTLDRTPDFRLEKCVFSGAKGEFWIWKSDYWDQMQGLGLLGGDTMSIYEHGNCTHENVKLCRYLDFFLCGSCCWESLASFRAF